MLRRIILRRNVASFDNRSAAYLKIGQYKHCLKNIELARKYGYPTEKEAAFHAREQKCLKNMQNHKSKADADLSKFYKLSYPANRRFHLLQIVLNFKKTCNTVGTPLQIRILNQVT